MEINKLKNLLSTVPVRKEKIDLYSPILYKYFTEYNFDDENIIRFLANVLNETGNFEANKENLYYTTERIKEAFPRAFVNGGYNYLEYLRNPVKLANLVYDDRRFPKIGLGNKFDGDGSKFIGRGLLQTTGRSNYTQLAKETGLDVVNHPELLEDLEFAVKSAILYWKFHNLSSKNSLLETRQVIAGNYSNNPFGYQKVLALYNKLKRNYS